MGLETGVFGMVPVKESLGDVLPEAYIQTSWWSPIRRNHTPLDAFDIIICLFIFFFQPVMVVHLSIMGAARKKQFLRKHLSQLG